ncbi:MAG: spore maturation protein [Clostridiales bacterium]|nr:spore maturation protein [Clostridiales bacterium]
MLNFLSTALVPLLASLIVLAGLRRRLDLFACFAEGARQGMGSILSLVPTLVALMVGVEMLSASGLLELLGRALAPAARLLGLPEALMPLVILRPISGNGSLSVLGDLIAKNGADSLVATAGAVILTSTETTLYTAGVYFGSVGARDTGPTIPAALLSDLIAVLVGGGLVKLMLFS